MTDCISEKCVLKIINVDFDVEGLEDSEVSEVDGDEAYLCKETIVVHPNFVQKVIKATEEKYKEANNG